MIDWKAIYIGWRINLVIVWATIRFLLNLAVFSIPIFAAAWLAGLVFKVLK
jgi:hypothetical protein